MLGSSILGSPHCSQRRSVSFPTGINLRAPNLARPSNPSVSGLHVFPSGPSDLTSGFPMPVQNDLKRVGEDTPVLRIGNHRYLIDSSVKQIDPFQSVPLVPVYS